MTLSNQMLKALITFIVALTLIWIAGFVIFIQIIHQLPDHQNDRTIKQANAADAFVVFTGGASRTQKGFDLLLQNPDAKLMISGVFESTTLQDLVASANISLIGATVIKQHCCIELDYQSQTTHDNVLNTLNWINKHKNIKNILIITSDYHVPRAQLLFQQLKDKNLATSSISFYPVSQPDDKKSPKYWGHILNEFHKTLYTYMKSVI
jgi:uncharacterized SAM-binding protein YcdF (DUF218 family)